MIDILHETPAHVVCVKPVGVAAQGTDAQSLPQLLSAQLGCEIFPVHRLDQAVGGVMVYAKSAKEAARLTQLMGQGQIRKQYLAVLTGCPEKPRGELEDLLFHDRTKNKTYVVRRARGGVKQARLSYEVLQQTEGFSLASVLLQTGRTHQIRVQFASRGLPLLGDGKYGSRDNRCTCALWSYRLTFPDKDQTRAFTATPPAQFPWSLFDRYPR